jgi:uncharacterized protein YkwD
MREAVMKFWKRFIAALAAAAMLLTLNPASVLADNSSTAITLSFGFNQSEARRGLDLVNAFRTGNEAWYWDPSSSNKIQASNLSGLIYDYDLEAAAMQRAAEISMNYSHDRLDGTDCFTAYPSDIGTAGENIAYGFTSVDSVMDAWKETNEGYGGQGHRRNMLNSAFNVYGEACVIMEGCKFWVQEFGYRAAPNTRATSAADSARNISVPILNSMVNTAEASDAANLLQISNVGSSIDMPLLNITRLKINADSAYDENAVYAGCVPVNWVSNNPGIAEIENGRITGVSAGVAVLTAEAFGKQFTAKIAVGCDIMYRLYNPNSGEHFYTANKAEKDSLVSLGWNFEGAGWYAPRSGSPVYRLYNSIGGEHHYTLNTAERDMLISIGWNDEKIGWYSGGSTPVYRDYNPNAFANNHNYTVSLGESSSLVSLGWRAEGIGWYGM